MSLVSITGQQRYDIALNTQLVEKLTQDFIETLGPLEADKAAPITTAIGLLIDALQVAGLAADPLLSTQAIVANAGTVVVKNSAGTTVAGTHTAEVAASALTDVKLASTVGTAVNSGAQTITVTTVGSRTAGQSDSKAVTFTVANGVITAISVAA